MAEYPRQRRVHGDERIRNLVSVLQLVVHESMTQGNQFDPTAVEIRWKK